MSRALAGLGLGALCAIAIACGAGQKPASTGAAPPPSAVGAEPGAMSRNEQHDEINRLVEDMTEELEQLKLPPPDDMAAGMGTQESPMEMGQSIQLPANDNTCKPGPSETCTDSCKLTTSICESATKICNIAAQLEGDAWAANKCASGKASCDKAKERCCNCM